MVVAVAVAVLRLGSWDAAASTLVLVLLLLRPSFVSCGIDGSVGVDCFAIVENKALACLSV